MPERAVALIAYEVLKVVAACHAINVLHGDIKVRRAPLLLRAPTALEGALLL